MATADPPTPTAPRLVWQPRDGRLGRRPDELAVEEPLEIRLAGAPGERAQVLTVTMRTPGSDFELATGWLLSEGVLGQPGELRAVRYCTDADVEGEQRYNIVTAELSPAALARHRGAGGQPARLTATTSSCGICGTASIQAITARLGPAPALALDSGEGRFELGDVLCWPDLLRETQQGFSRTGGLHAAGLVDRTGRMLVTREDVGRHNAVDKVIGWACQQALSGVLPFPLDALGLVVSGRTSFEIVQKALAAAIPLVVSVSAASSLAARLADERAMTLVGFVRDGSCTVYTHPERLLV